MRIGSVPHLICFCVGQTIKEVLVEALIPQTNLAPREVQGIRRIRIFSVKFIALR